MDVKSNHVTDTMDTLAKIVSLSRDIMQTSGFQGLHYGELSKALGITRAAIHHYFPSKLDLARRVISDYCEWTRVQLSSIDRLPDGTAGKFAAYARLYRSIVENGDQRLCPGGMLAAEVMTLPEELRDDIKAFFNMHVEWASRQFFAREPAEARSAHAARVVASLQGGLLVSRLYGGPACLDAIIASLGREIAGTDGDAALASLQA
jgi:TetR/AcrR family transcriptional repressor of nem operon